VGLLGALLAGAWYLLGAGGRTPDPAAGERSVAVLPFRATGTEDPGPIASGLHADLLTRLSNVSALKVISATSVERYRDTRLPLPAVADSLGVAWVVEGDVQRAGDAIQVNAQLIDPRTDTHAWAQTYRRELTTRNLFDIQSDITRRIAGALERDSSYALAWSGLSDALSILRYYDYAPADSVSGPAMEAARRAVELTPTSGEAHTSLGIALALRREGPEALGELQRAVELVPSYAEAYIWLGWLHLLLGNPEQALEFTRRSVELGPLAPAYHVFLAQARLANGLATDALRTARRAREIQRECGLTHFMEGVVLHHLGRHDEAQEALDRSRSLVTAGGTPTHDEIDAVLAATRAVSGDTVGARALRNRIDASTAPFSAGLVHAALGEKDLAFEAFGRTENWGSFSGEHVRYFFPVVLGPLRDDPRYEALIREVDRAWGLTPVGSLPDEARQDSGSSG